MFGTKVLHEAAYNVSIFQLRQNMYPLNISSNLTWMKAKGTPIMQPIYFPDHSWFEKFMHFCGQSLCQSYLTSFVIKIFFYTSKNSDKFKKKENWKELSMLVACNIEMNAYNEKINFLL